MILNGRRENGDTLVEVILAIALMSLVLVAAFNIVGASYRTAMLSKERVEAVSLAQQQAERLRALRDREMAGGTYVPFSAADFPQDGELLKPDLTKESCGAGGCLKNGLYRVILDDAGNSIGVSNDLLRNYSIKVRWTLAGTSEINETEIKFSLADRNPNNIKRDCAVVESCI